ncbi:TetR/AcrR family transcriptional regulator [Roseicitreum antarcticum]|uniref:Transcriptional regulator, TetR family n=1 Tax=Roseicitreum antarcticum TaxID=564137 RepID=A0A1H2TQK2_9RHOB|nr:TetR/AcrR family transcriptional regulator [Roseicitreum antarcticum]SDW46085.1 transcriptional regulator, TetR family [Roseicitreum antarcticum]
MTQPRKSDQTRQKILATGRRLVTTGGFGAVGLAALLKECGVPKGSFYYYFPSKEAFGQAMLEDYVAEYLGRVEALMATDDSAAVRLTAFCDAWLDQERQAGLVSTCLVVKLGAEVSDLSDAMRAVLDAGVKELTARLAALLEEGARDGSVMPQDDVQAAAQALYAQWLGAAILSKLSHDQIPLERAMTDTRKRLFTGTLKGKDQ